MKIRVFIKTIKEEILVDKWEYENMMHCRLWYKDNTTGDLVDKLFLKQDLIFIPEDSDTL